MYVGEYAMDTFVLVKAGWAVSRAREVVERLSPTHVIVHRVEPTYYYLYTEAEALHCLSLYPPDASVFTAFDLHENQATPALDAFAFSEGRPDRNAVIVDEGRVVGFFDFLAARRVIRHDPSATPPPPSVQRHSLVTEFPEQAQYMQTVSLLVWLATESEDGVPLSVSLPTGTTVDIIVQPRRGFTLEGAGEGSILITSEDETPPLQFKLKASELGPGKVRVLAFHQGQPIGAVTLAPTVVPTTQPADDRRLSHEQPTGALTAHQPDLSLLILEDESGGKPTLTFRLTALDPRLGLYLKPFGKVQLRTGPLEYFTEFFKDIESLPLDTPQDRAVAERRLAAKGATLFEALVPEVLREQLWSLRLRIRSVQVQSEEHWIPWELCRLLGEEDGRVVDGPFMCEAFAMTRWLPGIGLKPALTLNKMALVVPKDSGLPFATSERDYMLSLANGGRQVDRISATYLDVSAALASGTYDGWHFTGHGGFRAPDPNRSAMVLEKQDELTPEDLGGVVKNLGLAQPLVFLNACQIGRGGLSLTDIGGWAAQFLRAGAAAFIGAHWSVYDKPAHDFAQELYNRLLAGIPVGKAVQEARLEIKPLGDPTWLAYTVFADPLATVQ